MCTESFFIVFICSPGRVYRVEPLGAYVGNDPKASTVPRCCHLKKDPFCPDLPDLLVASGHPREPHVISSISLLVLRIPQAECHWEDVQRSGTIGKELIDSTGFISRCPQDDVAWFGCHSVSQCW